MTELAPAPSPAPTPSPAPAPAPAPTAWHNGIDPAVIGYATNKGWIDADPKVTFGKVIESYRNAESKLSAPPDKLIRMPEPNAAPADLDAFWQRFGAVKEAKDLDFSAIKNARGEAINPNLATAIATTAISARVPKDAVLAVTTAVQKHLDGIEAEQTATYSAKVQEQMAALEKNWGKKGTPSFEANLFDSKRGLGKWMSAIGVDEAKAIEGIDALSKLTGIGASTVMELGLALHRLAGEPKYIDMKPGANGTTLPTSAAAATARMDELKKDIEWTKRWANGGVAEKEEWKKLLQIKTGQSSYIAA